MIFLNIILQFGIICFHVITIDMSTRPHEILNLKFSQIVFEKAKDGKQYVEVQ